MIFMRCENGSCVAAIYREAFDFLSAGTTKLLEDNLKCISCMQNFSSGACVCGGSKPDPILEHFHKKNFGAKGTFWGLYEVNNHAWTDIEKAINRDKRLNIEANPQLARFESKRNATDVQNWIDRVFPGNGLTTKCISIPANRPPSKKQKDLHTIFEACFRVSETKLHAYLKWFSYWHLSRGDGRYFFESVRLCGIGLEVKYSLPGNRVTIQYSGGKGSIVPPEWSAHWDWTSSIMKIADVYSGVDRMIVECGITDALSLVAPVKAKVAKRVLWVPYPKSLDKNAEIDGFDFECQAYLIHAKRPEHLRRHSKKNEEKNNDRAKT